MRSLRSVRCVLRRTHSARTSPPWTRSSTSSPAEATSWSTAAEFAAIIEDLSAGAEKLDKGFSTVLGKVPNRTEAQRDSVASALTTPVLLKEKTLNEADTFGTGFAPFFMSLSLFVAVSSSG